MPSFKIEIPSLYSLPTKNCRKVVTLLIIYNYLKRGWIKEKKKGIHWDYDNENKEKIFKILPNYLDKSRNVTIFDLVDISYQIQTILKEQIEIYNKNKDFTDQKELVNFFDALKNKLFLKDKKNAKSSISTVLHSLEKDFLIVRNNVNKEKKIKKGILLTEKGENYAYDLIKEYHLLNSEMSHYLDIYMKKKLFHSELDQKK